MPQRTGGRLPLRVSVRVDKDQRTGLYRDSTLTDNAEALMQTIFYARVSTADQTLELQEKQARAAGFKLDMVIADHGVSGVSTRLVERPEGRRLFDILRAGDVLIVRWVDRLGRNYADVTETIRTLIGRGVVVKTLISGMTFDGTAKDPMQKAVRDALIGFMAATAEAQAEATKIAQRAGIDHAKASQGNPYRGRKPSFTRDQMGRVTEMKGEGAGVSAIAKETGLSRQSVYRIISDKAGAEATLRQWGL
jgi:DNA invertase Pin-like site-specific DNA recombinase